MKKTYIAIISILCVSLVAGQCNKANVTEPSYTDVRVNMAPEFVLFTRSPRFVTVLYLSHALNTEETFKCVVRVHVNQSEAVNSADCTPGDNGNVNQTMLVTPAPVGNDWILDEYDVVFKAHETVKYLKVERSAGVTSLETELVKVSCCNSDTNSSFQSHSVYMLAQVQLSFNPIIDSQETNKRSNPAFVDLSPCPCDLTLNECDLYCCCDELCKGDVNKLFTGCVRGMFGGKADLETFRCASDHYERSDWFPLMCVHSEINALLGRFYMDEEKGLTSTREFLSRQESALTQFSFLEKNSRTVTETMNRYHGNYTYGEIIKTAKPLNNWNGIQEERGEFSLPQKVLNGECLDNTPVRFLKDFESRCIYRVSAHSCAQNPIFDALNFPTSTRGTLECRLYVLRNNSAIVNTTVSYRCADLSRADVAKRFVKSASGEINSTESMFFPANGRSVVEPNIRVCNWSLERPLYDQNGGLCKNVVLGTRFTLKWRKGEVTHLTGEITVGDVRNGETITQTHSVVYKDQLAPAVVIQRSGNPGINVGSTIQSGVKESRSINVTDKHQLKLVKTDATGLCKTASCRGIEFGVDATSSCIIKLKMADFNSCPDLKHKLVEYLDGMMPSDRLGRLGYNDRKQTDVNRWKVIYRQNITEHYTQELIPPINQPAPSTKNKKLPGWCVNVTSGIHLDILYTMSGKSRGVATYEIIAATINYTLALWRMSCPKCAGQPIPAPAINPNPTNITNNTNNTNATSSNTTDSGGNATTVVTPADIYTEDYELTMSVRFIQVPPQTQPRVMRYWKDYDASLCKYETCWSEFMFPLTAAFTGDPKAYTLGLTCAIIVVFIFFLTITRPWW